jgi:O-antigen/teichoic acid export membrane protein
MAEFAKGIINNYFSVAGAQIISAPLSLLYLSLVTRMMSPLNYGKFALVLASFQFFYTVFVSWIRNATVRFGSEEFTRHNKLNKIFAVQFSALSFAIIFVSFLIMIYKKNIAEFTGLTTGIHLYILIYLVFYAFFDLACQLLQSSHQIQRYGLSLVIRQCLILGLVILFFVLKIKLTPLSLISVETLSYLALLLFVVYPLFRSGYLRPVVLNKGVFFDVLKYSWPVMILYVLGYFSSWADTLLIRMFLTFESVGRYEVANRLMQYVFNLILPISIIAFPTAVSIKSKGRDDLIYKYAQRVIPQASFFWGIFIMLLMLGSGLIFKFVFGSQYSGSILIFRILLIGLSFQFLSVMYTAILQSYDFNKELVFIALVTVILNLSADLLLIPKIGITGAALSKAASFVICGLLYMLRSIKCAKIEGENYRNSVYFLALPVVVFACFIFTANFFIAVFVTLLCVVISYSFAKRINLFTEADTHLVRQLDMPEYLKSFIVKMHKGFY